MQEHASSSVSDFLDLALTQIPTYFGKLVLLADLKDEATGQVMDPLAVLACGKPLDDVFERRHREIFFAWLCRDLTTQLTDVAQYLAVDRAHGSAQVARWIRERLYERLIPPSATAVERSLFVSDLMAILLLLQARLNSSGERRDE
jgi:hypothetical protein